MDPNPRMISKGIALALCLCLAANAAPGHDGKAQVPAEAAARAVPQADAKRNSVPATAQPLNDQELAELAKRAQQPGPEVTGGALSNEHLTYIVIALAAAVIVLIAK